MASVLRWEVAHGFIGILSERESMDNMGHICKCQVQRLLVRVLSLEVNSTRHTCNLHASTNTATLREDLMIVSTCMHVALLDLSMGKRCQTVQIAPALKVRPSRS